MLNRMSTISKIKILKRMSPTPGMTPVKKQLCKFTNLRTGGGWPYTGDGDPVPDFDEKVVVFLI